MRRLGLGIFSVVVLAALLWTGWWFYLTQRLSAGLDAWAAARRAEGWTVTIGSRSRGGWPGTARLVLRDATVRGAGPILPARLDWHAARIDLDLPPLSPTVLVLRPRGAQLVSVGGGPALSVEGALQVQLDLQRLSPPVPLSFAAHDLRIAPRSGGAPALITRLSGDAAIDPGAGAKADAVSLEFASGRIDLPPGRPWPLGHVVQSASGDLAVTGPVPPDGAPRERAQIWQRAGGTLRLRQGALHWGPLEAAATGTGGLDAALQPSGETVIHATGFAQAMDVLAAHHVLPEHAALVAKAVLSLLADTPSGGGAAVLTVPLSLRDGTVAAHGIPLVRVSPLAWR